MPYDNPTNFKIIKRYFSLTTNFLPANKAAPVADLVS